MDSNVRVRSLSSCELFMHQMLYNRKRMGSLPLTSKKVKDKNDSEMNACFIKHVPMKLTRNSLTNSRKFNIPIPKKDHINNLKDNFSNKKIRESKSFGGLQIQNNSQRRESFLYKYEEDSSISPERYSRQTSVLSKESNSAECVEDIIVTPFAQILAVLHRIRANVSEMPQLKLYDEKENDIHLNENIDTQLNLTCEFSDIFRAKESMYMLDWCLANLENIQTDRSVSSLATVKKGIIVIDTDHSYTVWDKINFKKMLNFELHQYDETDQVSKADHQISDYICTTFLEDNFDRDDNYSDCLSSISKKSNPEDIADGKEKNLDKKIFSRFGISFTEASYINEVFESSLNTWSIDLFEIHEISHNVLTLVTYAIFKNRQIIQTFNIPNDILINFLLKIEVNYKSLPYHNSIHAADVIQTANVILQSDALQNIFTDLEIFSVLFACVIHDVGHPGVTNQFLINTNDHLATLYNDQSVLENHHLATSFTIIKDKNYDILRNLTKQERSTFRKSVIDMVLATDMSRHMNLLADLKTMVETKKVSGSGLLDMDKYNDRVTILQNLVHCADLSNPTKPRVIYEKWVSRIMEEFFLQGDKEKELGLDVSAMCDRENSAVDKTQVGFIDYIVHPLWEAWGELVHPDAHSVLETLAENRYFYFTKTCPSQTITEVDSDEDSNESQNDNL